MNVLLLLLICLIVFGLAYALYSRYISRVLHSCDRVLTPAHAQRDGVDYVPTPSPVLFSHHYATIAGAGPIVGPAIAAIYGLWPALGWVLIGSAFFGAVHDYTTLFVSLRERGRSIAEISHSITGRWGFILYIGFTLLMIIILTAAFLDLSVQALLSTASAQTLSLPLDNPFHWQTSAGADGVEMVKIGGIATTSVIIITLLAPVIGLLIHKVKINMKLAVVIALVVAAGSVWFGMYHPVSFTNLEPAQIRLLWMSILSAYCLLASAVPVWIILQPRDFVNSFNLYIGMALLIIVIIAAGIQGIHTDPQLGFNIAEGTRRLGSIWPVLFITIACGAISGFHSLAASGTSAKQCNRESDARRIGYGAMLAEGLLAVLVLIAIGAGLGHDHLIAVQWPETGSGNTVLAFAMGMGMLSEKALGLPVYIGTIFGLLMVEGFIVTTLDTAVRLNRYLFEELWSFLFGPDRTPKVFKNYYFNSALSVAAMLALAVPNGWKAIWPVFGTTNQLLAALTLAAISIWLAVRLRPAWFTLLPAAFMMVTCIASLGVILHGQLKPGAHTNWAIVVLSVILLLLGVGVVWLTGRKLWDIYRGRFTAIKDDPADAFPECQAAAISAAPKHG